MPAPIISRTTPAPQAPVPVAPPEPSAPPAPDIVTNGAPAIDPAVTAAPIRSPGSGIEVRPLESRPLDGGPAASSAAARNLPRLVKRPYSDQALAELQAADATSGFRPAPVPGSAGAATPATPPPTAATADAAATPAPAASAAASSRGMTFAWPARGRIVQPFADPRSLGIVIDGVIGDPVSAAADGRVIFSGNGPRGYGNLLIIKHDDDTVSVYGHNRSLLVKEGQTVKRGQKVAELGDSSADRPGLLFEVRKQGKPVDPMQFLPKR
ncbi:MAG: peptidoglycan DD-metalloendopeptidase family protein [Burkholderiaceae bacterium]